MTLDQQHVTLASRRTIPTYPGFCIVVGSSWAFGGRLNLSPGLSFAGQWTPVMGFVVMLVGLWLAVCAALGQLGKGPRLDYRRAYVYGLGGLMGWMYVWAGVLALAFIFGHSTWGAWAWPAAFGRFCWASMVSLESREI